MNIKAIIFTASVLVCGFTLFSCASQSENENAATDTVQVTETTAAETEYLDTLPKTNFEGAEFNIIAQHMATRPNFSLGELNGDVLNDALYERERTIEELYNVVINDIGFEDRGVVKTNVSKAALAGDTAYDLVLTSLADGINTLMPAGLLYDLTSLPNIDFSREWWNKSIGRNTTFSGKTYTTTGAITASYYYTPLVLAFNKKLCDEYGVESVYSLVESGGWTVDKVADLIKDLSHDVNGDGTITADDFYGLMLDEEAGKGIFVSAGGKLTEADSSGSYSLALDSDKNITLLTKLNGIFGNRETSLLYQSLNSDNVKNFTESRIVFTFITMGNIIGDFRSMEDDYGIAPLPKLDEAQAEYLTHGNPWGPCGVAVPISLKDPEMTGLIMEALAYVSFRTVIPAVYEITLQEKIARDKDSQTMLDLIYKDIYFDLNGIYDFGGSASLVRQYVVGAKADFVSAYTSLKDRAIAALDDIIKAQAENG
jgi:hypothetical protein